MPATASYWLPFDASQPKRKRAELVCVLCHSKKVKCDLQARHGQGYERCTNCNASDKECQLRPSRRTKHRRVTEPGYGRTTFTPPPEHEPEHPDEPETAAERDPDNDDGDEMNSDSRADMRLDTIQVASPEIHPPSISWAQSDAFAHEDLSLIPSDHAPEQQHLQAESNGPPTGPSPQSQNSTESRAGMVSESQKGDIDTGFLQIYGRENEFDAQEQTSKACALQQRPSMSDPQEQQLTESFIETYWEYCYAWCPVLDPDTVDDEIANSPLLANALATAASHIQPPLVSHRGPAEYYKTARTIFYDDEEPYGLTTLKAVALFYWWAPRPPTVVHRHSSWWWTSVLIRHAQQMNLHREPALDSPMRANLSLSVRRRIWWTAFARERLTALCQSKPAIIDQDDCNVQAPTLLDFPQDQQSQRKGTVFIHWVSLCSIIGKVAKTLFRLGYPSSASPCATPSSNHHMQELVNWVNSLPPQLQLQIKTPWTRNLDRDVHQLHLPYLTTVIILHLKRSENALPQALPPAILAASCIARILRDILARGNTRFLMAITCWYCGTAFIPLLQATRVPHLSKDANECIDILERTVEQLQTMWATANVIRRGFERLRATANELLSPDVLEQMQQDTHLPEAVPASAMGQGAAEDFDWTTLFPFVTRQTNGIADSLMADREQGIVTGMLPSGDSLYHETLMTQFDSIFFDQYPDYGLDFTATL